LKSKERNGKETSESQIEKIEFPFFIGTIWEEFSDW
jgi:hypothetical protein